MNKLDRKDFTIAVKTGSDANKSKFAKEAVKGEAYYSTDLQNLYFAQSTAGLGDAILMKIVPSGYGFQNTYKLSFDGVDDYLGSKPISRLNSATWSTTTPITMSAWAKVDSFATNDSVFGFARHNSDGSRNPSFGGSASGIHVGNNNNFYLWWNATQHYLTGTFSANTWYHFVFTWDGSAGVVYVNGSSNKTFSNAANSYNTNLCIFAGGGGRWDGYSPCHIDEIALWDSALSASDVQAIYNNGAPGFLLNYNPLVWYRMGDGAEAASGSTIYDESGNNNADAILFNGGSFTKYVFENNYSLDFDGVDDYLTLTSAPSSDFNFGTGDFGLSMWVKADIISSTYHAVLGSYEGSANNWQVFIGSAGLNIWNGALYGGGTINAGVWYNCVVTRSSGVLKTYINGQQNSSNTVTTSYTPSTSASTRIGAPSGGGWPAWDGLIDEVAVFNSALSASDVTSIYNNGTPTSVSSLNPLGWWRMGDRAAGTGTIITDQGSGGNNGTLVNGPTFSTDVP